MVVRRPLVISGQFLSEADDNDGKVILGSITYGSGLGEQSENYEDNYTANLYLTAASSGLLFVLNGGSYKLTNDGSDLAAATAALISGNQALLEVAPAYASGIEAQRIATEALASGNSALLANLSGIQQSSAAVSTSAFAVLSGDAAFTTSNSYLTTILDATSSGVYATASGIAANVDAVTAYSSGVAALEALAADPFISQDALIGLIMGLA